MTDAVALPTTSPPPQLSRGRLVGRRLVAAGIDLVLLPSLLARLGDVLLGGTGEWIGRVLGVGAAITTQGLIGVSLGMAVVGLVVVRADGDVGPPGLRRAALRHAWLLALLLAAIPSLMFWLHIRHGLQMVVGILGSLLSFVGICLPPVLLGTVIADAEGRGLHDRWSGTAVVATPAPAHPVATVGILLLLWATMTGASWWLGEPDRVDSDRLGSAGVQSATCDVRYDPPVGEPQQATVELARGMERVELRLGPHVARFDDEPFPSTGRPFYSDDDGTEGLFYELRSQSTGGSSSSSSGGSSGSSFDREIELGGGLAGDLTMECSGEDDGGGVDTFTPSVTRPTDRPSG